MFLLKGEIYMATFRKLPSGRWQARVMIDGVYKPVGMFATKKEAEIYAAEIERKLYYNEVLPDREMMFQEVLDDWFKRKESENKGITVEQLEILKRLHFEHYFGHKVVFNINKQDVEEWLDIYENAKNKKGEPKYSYGSKIRFLGYLKEVFNHAVHEMEILNRNPAERVRVKYDGNVSIKKDVKYYSLTELNFLLDYLRNYDPPRYPEYKPYYVLVYFLSRTGLRISEALSLKWEDIDGNRLKVY